MVSLSQRIPLPFTAVEVEALVARRGLELALETGFGRVILEGDSKILITALKEHTHSLANFGHIAQDIQYLASHFSSIEYTHVHRQCNNVAHLLARRAVSYPQFQVWMEDVPLDITYVLQADVNGLY